MLAEPVKLVGEGIYHLNNLKEITVTKSYLKLNNELKDCQNEDEIMNCETKISIDTFLKECDCLPLSIWSRKNKNVSQQANENMNFYLLKTLILILGTFL